MQPEELLNILIALNPKSKNNLIMLREVLLNDRSPEWLILNKRSIGLTLSAASITTVHSKTKSKLKKLGVINCSA